MIRPERRFFTHEVREIRAEALSRPIIDIARDRGVAPAGIRAMVLGFTYKDVPGWIDRRQLFRPRRSNRGA